MHGSWTRMQSLVIRKSIFLILLNTPLFSCLQNNVTMKEKCLLFATVMMHFTLVVPHVEKPRSQDNLSRKPLWLVALRFVLTE